MSRKTQAEVGEFEQSSTIILNFGHLPNVTLTVLSTDNAGLICQGPESPTPSKSTEINPENEGELILLALMLTLS